MPRRSSFEIQLLERLKKISVDPKLPQKPITNCLKCRGKKVSRKGGTGLCRDCESSSTNKEIKQFSTLVIVAGSDSTVEPAFDRYLSEKKLNFEILASYCEVLMDKQARTIEGWILTGKQWAIRLQTIFASDEPSFDVEFRDLMKLRKNSDFSGQIARAEALYFLRKFHSVELAEIQDSFDLIENYQMEPRITEKVLIREFSQFYWSNKNVPECNLLDEAREQIAWSKKIQEADCYLSELKNYPYSKVIEAWESVLHLMNLGYNKEVFEEPNFQMFLNAFLEQNTTKISQLTTNFDSILRAHGRFLLTRAAKAINEEVQALALDARELLFEVVKIGGGYKMPRSNPLIDRMEKDGKRWNLDLDQVICRFVCIVRDELDPSVEYDLQQWLNFLLVKENRDLWMEIISIQADPTDDELSAARFRSKVDYSRLQHSNSQSFSGSSGGSSVWAPPQSSNPYRGRWK